MSETNGAEPDLHRIIHGLQLELSSVASKLSSRNDDSDLAQIHRQIC